MTRGEMRYFTLREAAEQLGLAPGTLRLQAEHGRIRASKIADRWVVTQAAIDSYRREHLRAGRQDQEGPTGSAT